MENWLILTILCVLFFNGRVTVEGLKNVKKGEYPFMAYLYYPNEKSEWRRFLEAAILITPEWLVSSAIDLDYSSAGSPSRQLTARMGAVTVDAKFGPLQDDDEQERQIIEVVKSREDWWKREINLLRAAIPFEASDAVRPVPITTARANVEGRSCDVLVYSQYANEDEDKYLIQYSVTILKSDVDTCGKNFDQRAMTCGLNEENITAIIDPDFCQDNSGGPLICNGEVIGLQSYVDNDDCKPPYFYQMFWAWNQFITCGTNDCEGDCDAICTSKYKNEITDNHQLMTMSNTSSEKTSNDHSFGEFADGMKNTLLTYENNSQNIIEESLEKEVVQKKENDSHKKELEIPRDQKIEKEHKTKAGESTILEEDQISTNSKYFSSKKINLKISEDEATSTENQNIKNKLIEEDHNISLTKSNESLEKNIKLDTNDDEQKEYYHLLSSKDQLKEDKSKTREYQTVSDEDSSTNDSSYTHQHKVTSENNQDALEENSLSEEDKKEKVTEEEDNNASEGNTNVEGNKEKSEDNTSEDSSEDSSNKTEHVQNFIEREESKSTNQIDITNENNGDSALEETKIEKENEKVSTISELNISKSDKETSSETNEDNISAEAKHNPENENNTTDNGKPLLSNEQKYLEENNVNSLKKTETKSGSQNDSIENESILSVYKEKSLKDGKENDHNEINSKHQSSQEESSNSRSDNEYKNDKKKEERTPENGDQSESKRISYTEKIISEQDTKSEDHTKGATPTTPGDLKSSKKEENSNHSTEPNESHSNHIIMEVTSVVIKTVEDLLYAHRNTSRHYAARTTVDLNDTEILLTPKPKFGKMGRTMADHAGARVNKHRIPYFESVTAMSQEGFSQHCFENGIMSKNGMEIKERK